METASDDKRQKVRVDFQVEIEAIFGDLKIQLKADSKNISLNGVFIESDEDIPLNTPCQVALYLSGTTEPVALTMEGRVARKAQNGFAVNFEAMDLESFTQLKQILRYNTGDPDLI
jgi:PilZ domain-containing protein